jgi:hypothetical protein
MTIVGQTGSRPDEDLVSQSGGLVDQGVVLDLAVVTDGHACVDVGTSPDDASATEPSAFPYLGKLPHS